MSDYLGSLLLRSFSPTLAVRPKIPSVFEPAADTALNDSPTDPDFETESVTVDSASAHVTPSAPAPAHPAEPPAAPSAPVIPAWLPANSRSAAVATHRTDATPSDRPLTSPEVGSTTRPRAVLPADTNQSVPTPSLRAGLRTEPTVHPWPPLPQFPALRPAVPRFISAAPTPVQPHENAPPKSPPVAVHGDPPTTRTRPAAQATPSGIIVRPLHREREIITPAKGTIGRKNPDRSPREITPAPLPSIQITIGRVEVRASVPAAPAARPPSKKEPEMTLDAYFQRRAQGGRR